MLMSLNPVTISTEQLILRLHWRSLQESQDSYDITRTCTLDIMQSITIDMVYLKGSGISKSTVHTFSSQQSNNFSSQSVMAYRGIAFHIVEYSIHDRTLSSGGGNFLHSKNCQSGKNFIGDFP